MISAGAAPATHPPRPRQGPATQARNTDHPRAPREAYNGTPGLECARGQKTNGADHEEQTHDPNRPGLWRAAVVRRRGRSTGAERATGTGRQGRQDAVELPA